jgi:hypothetical protein
MNLDEKKVVEVCWLTRNYPEVLQAVRSGYAHRSAVMQSQKLTLLGTPSRAASLKKMFRNIVRSQFRKPTA